MTILDISGSGLFSHSDVFFHALGTVIKLAAGSFIIVSMAIMAIIGSTVYSLSKGYQTRSLVGGARTFVHAVSYVIGATVALIFALLAGMLFSLAGLKLLFAAVLIAFTTAFVVRETFLFLVLKRFGKYLMYFTALQYVKENVFNNGQQQNPTENSNQ